MNLLKKMQYKYLQSSYRPAKNQFLGSKKTAKLLNEIESALDKQISKLMGEKKEKDDD